MKKVPVFATLSRPDLEKLARRIVHQQYSKGTVILSAGDRTDSISIINTGRIKASRYAADGREQIVYLFAEGDFFGEHGLFNDERTPYQIEALTDVKLCRLYRSDFQDLLREYPALSLQIIAVLSSRLASLERIVGVQNLDARIKGLLRDYADRYGRQQSGSLLVRLPMSREGIASQLGIARETLSRRLSQLEQEGIIRPVGNKSIRILKPASLEEQPEK